MTDQVSQSKIFIDVGGTGGSSRLLEQIESMDVKDGRSTEVTVTIGGFKGFKRKEGGFEIDLSVYHEIGKNPEVNWRALKRAARTFTLTQQDEFSGMREVFTCQVSKVDSKSDKDGMHQDTVTLAATYAFDDLTGSLL